MRVYKYLLFLPVFMFCGIMPPVESPPISELHFIGQYEVPHNKSFKGTTIGGLSGIDYDPKRDVYYLISDDRSAIDPARFYTARIFLTEKGIDSIRFTDVHTLRQPNGLEFPNATKDPAHTPDPEAIRYDARTHQLVWTSEGERIIRENHKVLLDPAITVMDIDGKYSHSYPLPLIASMQENEKGPRQNGVLEGLTFAPDFKNLFVSVEMPLYEDGPEAGLTENNARIRIFKFDAATKKNVAQYAYRLDPIAYPSSPENAFKINGVSDILAVTDNSLLVVERSFSMGRLPCTIKVFLADLSQADDIISIASMKENTAIKTATKKLLLNMDALGIYTDNIEGVTFGPNLPNGHRTLIFESDNNFHPLEKTQFLLFEVIQ